MSCVHGNVRFNGLSSLTCFLKPLFCFIYGIDIWNDLKAAITVNLFREPAIMICNIVQPLLKINIHIASYLMEIIMIN